MPRSPQPRVDARLAASGSCLRRHPGILPLRKWLISRIIRGSWLRSGWTCHWFPFGSMTY